jgi:hypothetical protein
MDETPEMQLQLMSSHGMLAILEILEGRSSREVVMKLLQRDNRNDGYTISPCGYMPKLSEAIHRIHFEEITIGMPPGSFKFHPVTVPYVCFNPSDVHFVSIVTNDSFLTQMQYVRCRGLKVLVDLLDEDYTEQAELIVHALNGMGSVFELQSPKK